MKVEISKSAKEIPLKAEFCFISVDNSVEIVEKLSLFGVWKTFFDKQEHKSMEFDFVRQNQQNGRFRRGERILP